MKEALSKSVNTIAVKALEKTGVEQVVRQAKKMGISEKLPELPSIALGTAEIKMTELAKAYTSYLNQGKPVAPMLIRNITDAKDSTLVTFKSKKENTAAFSIANGQYMLEMLKATVNSGTASRIRSSYGLTNDIAGKTGTTQNNKDAWFVALTPKMLHISWVGLDNHEIGFKSSQLGQGANAALPLFAGLYQKMNKNPKFNRLTNARFPVPSAEVLQSLDCEPVKRDGFLKRLFKNPNKKKIKKFKNSGIPK
jgi:penicillin-binding protein 1A